MCCIDKVTFKLELKGQIGMNWVEKVKKNILGLKHPVKEMNF